jgi:ABC-type phosphate/phosphonate transport system substrate-binding protein
MLIRTLSLIFTGLLYTSACQAEEFSLAIQPILPEQKLIENYQPLADYLSKATGHTIKISTYRNFLYYWTKMRRGKKGFDLALDAAHFTDYRVKAQGYKVLAKLPDTVSFSIVTSEDNFILDVDELIGLRIATMPSPSLGSLRLEELFPNPMRIPIFIWESNTTVALNKLISGEIDAAIIPTRLASTYSNLNIVMTTEPVPHMGLSASPDVPPEVTDAIRNALINATQTIQGQNMLSALKLDLFEAADESVYEGYADLLKDVHGFDKKILN